MTLSIVQASKQNTSQNTNEVLQSSTDNNGRLNRHTHSNDHTVSQNYTSQLVDTYSNSNATNESVTVAYITQSDFDRHMIDSLIATGNIFAALKLANEINELNEYNVIGDYHIRYVKDYFIKEESERGKSDTNDFTNNEIVKSKVENMEYENTKSEIEKKENGISKKQKVESENAKCKYRQLQKGYMKMMNR